MRPNLIFQGHCIRIWTVTPAADEFVAGLSETNQRALLACSATVDRSLELGRPSARIARISGSHCGLFEMRVTPPGRRGPQTRLFYITDKREFLVLRGTDKRRPKLLRSDIELAERDAVAHRRERRKRNSCS